MCTFCSELCHDSDLCGEDLMLLLLRLHYGVLERKLEMLGGEPLWLAVMGQRDTPLPPFARFDFGCLGCSAVHRLTMDLLRYHATWGPVA